MPLYEYRCVDCSATTDIRHGFDESTTERCPRCNGALTKNFNVSGIVFKGSGFYVNDSRGGSKGSESAKSSSDSASSVAPATPAAAPATPAAGGSTPAAPSSPTSPA